VAPVVVWVIVVSALLIHEVGVDDGALAVLFGVTVIVAVPDKPVLPQPFASVTETRL